jgi:hypothetical protein
VNEKKKEKRKQKIEDRFLFARRQLWQLDGEEHRELGLAQQNLV